MLEFIKSQIEFLKDSTLQGRLSAGIIERLQLHKNIIKGMQLENLESSVQGMKDLQNNIKNNNISKQIEKVENITSATNNIKFNDLSKNKSTNIMKSNPFYKNYGNNNSSTIEMLGMNKAFSSNSSDSHINNLKVSNNQNNVINYNNTTKFKRTDNNTKSTNTTKLNTYKGFISKFKNIQNFKYLNKERKEDENKLIIPTSTDNNNNDINKKNNNNKTNINESNSKKNNNKIKKPKFIGYKSKAPPRKIIDFQDIKKSSNNEIKARKNNTIYEEEKLKSRSFSNNSSNKNYSSSVKSSFNVTNKNKKLKRHNNNNTIKEKSEEYSIYAVNLNKNRSRESSIGSSSVKIEDIESNKDKDNDYLKRKKKSKLSTFNDRNTIVLNRKSILKKAENNINDIEDIKDNNDQIISDEIKIYNNENTVISNKSDHSTSNIFDVSNSHTQNLNSRRLRDLKKKDFFATMNLLRPNKEYSTSKNKLITNTSNTIVETNTKNDFNDDIDNEDSEIELSMKNVNKNSNRNNYNICDYKRNSLNSQISLKCRSLNKILKTQIQNKNNFRNSTVLDNNTINSLSKYRINVNTVNENSSSLNLENNMSYANNESKAELINKLSIDDSSNTISANKKGLWMDIDLLSKLNNAKILNKNINNVNNTNNTSNVQNCNSLNISPKKFNYNITKLESINEKINELNENDSNEEKDINKNTSKSNLNKLDIISNNYNSELSLTKNNLNLNSSSFLGKETIQGKETNNIGNNENKITKLLGDRDTKEVKKAKEDMSLSENIGNSSNPDNIADISNIKNSNTNNLNNFLSPNYNNCFFSSKEKKLTSNFNAKNLNLNNTNLNNTDSNNKSVNDGFNIRLSYLNNSTIRSIRQSFNNESSNFRSIRKRTNNSPNKFNQLSVYTNKDIFPKTKDIISTVNNNNDTNSNNNNSQTNFLIILSSEIQHLAKPSNLANISNQEQNKNDLLESSNNLKNNDSQEISELELSRKATSSRFIQRFANLYDSLSEEEGELFEYQPLWYSIHPKSEFIHKWKNIHTGVISIIMVFYPIMLAFGIENTISLLALELLTDLFFISHILVRCLTGVRLNNEIAFSLRIIFSRYLKETSSIIDFIAAIPISFIKVIIYIVQQNNDDSNSNNTYNTINNVNFVPFISPLSSSSLLQQGKFFYDISYILKFILIFHLVKWVQISYIYKKRNKSLIDSLKRKNVTKFLAYVINLIDKIKGLVMIVSFFLILTHTCSCVFIYLGKISLSSTSFTSTDIDFYVKNWIYQSGFIDSAKSTIYLNSLYFTFTTFFTIGYGDITPYNTYERLFVSFLLIVGCFIYSYMLTTGASIFEDHNKRNQLINRKKEILTKLAKEYTLYDSLHEKILKSITQTQVNWSEDIIKFLDSLPMILKNELSIKMYLQRVKNINFFKKKSNNFIIFTVPLLKINNLMKNEVIWSVGETIEEMIFVYSGNLGITLGSAFDKYTLAHIKENENYGEVVMLDSNPLSNYDIYVTSKNCKLFILKKLDFVNIIENFTEEVEETIIKSVKFHLRLEDLKIIANEYYKINLTFKGFRQFYIKYCIKREAEIKHLKDEEKSNYGNGSNDVKELDNQSSIDDFDELYDHFEGNNDINEMIMKERVRRDSITNNTYCGNEDYIGGNNKNAYGSGYSSGKNGIGDAFQTPSFSNKNNENNSINNQINSTTYHRDIIKTKLDKISNFNGNINKEEVVDNNFIKKKSIFLKRNNTNNNSNDIGNYLSSNNQINAPRKKTNNSNLLSSNNINDANDKSDKKDLDLDYDSDQDDEYLEKNYHFKFADAIPDIQYDPSIHKKEVFNYCNKLFTEEGILDRADNPMKAYVKAKTIKKQLTRLNTRQNSFGNTNNNNNNTININHLNTNMNSNDLALAKYKSTFLGFNNEYISNNIINPNNNYSSNNINMHSSSNINNTGIKPRKSILFHTNSINSINNINYNNMNNNNHAQGTSSYFLHKSINNNFTNNITNNLCQLNIITNKYISDNENYYNPVINKNNYHSSLGVHSSNINSVSNININSNLTSKNNFSNKRNSVLQSLTNLINLNNNTMNSNSNNTNDNDKTSEQFRNKLKGIEDLVIHEIDEEAKYCSDGDFRNKTLNKTYVNLNLLENESLEFNSNFQQSSKKINKEKEKEKVTVSILSNAYNNNNNNKGGIFKKNKNKDSCSYNNIIIDDTLLLSNIHNSNERKVNFNLNSSAIKEHNKNMRNNKRNKTKYNNNIKTRKLSKLVKDSIPKFNYNEHTYKINAYLDNYFKNRIGNKAYCNLDKKLFKEKNYEEIKFHGDYKQANSQNNKNNKNNKTSTKEIHDNDSLDNSVMEMHRITYCELYDDVNDSVFCKSKNNMFVNKGNKGLFYEDVFDLVGFLKSAGYVNTNNFVFSKLLRKTGNNVRFNSNKVSLYEISNNAYNTLFKEGNNKNNYNSNSKNISNTIITLDKCVQVDINNIDKITSNSSTYTNCFNCRNIIKNKHSNANINNYNNDNNLCISSFGGISNINKKSIFKNYNDVSVNEFTYISNLNLINNNDNNQDTLFNSNSNVKTENKKNVKVELLKFTKELKSISSVNYMGACNYKYNNDNYNNQINQINHINNYNSIIRPRISSSIFLKNNNSNKINNKRISEELENAYSSSSQSNIINKQHDNRKFTEINISINNHDDENSRNSKIIDDLNNINNIKRSNYSSDSLSPINSKTSPDVFKGVKNNALNANSSNNKLLNLNYNPNKVQRNRKNSNLSCYSSIDNRGFQSNSRSGELINTRKNNNEDKDLNNPYSLSRVNQVNNHVNSNNKLILLKHRSKSTCNINSTNNIDNNGLWTFMEKNIPKFTLFKKSISGRNLDQYYKDLNQSKLKADKSDNSKFVRKNKNCNSCSCSNNNYNFNFLNNQNIEKHNTNENLRFHNQKYNVSQQQFKLESHIRRNTNNPYRLKTKEFNTTKAKNQLRLDITNSTNDINNISNINTNSSPINKHILNPSIKLHSDSNITSSLRKNNIINSQILKENTSSTKKLNKTEKKIMLNKRKKYSNTNVKVSSLDFIHSSNLNNLFSLYHNNKATILMNKQDREDKHVKQYKHQISLTKHMVKDQNLELIFKEYLNERKKDSVSRNNKDFYLLNDVDKKYIASNNLDFDDDYNEVNNLSRRRNNRISNNKLCRKNEANNK